MFLKHFSNELWKILTSKVVPEAWKYTNSKHFNVYYLGQSTQAQVWLDVQFSDFHMLPGMHYKVTHLTGLKVVLSTGEPEKVL